MDEPQRVVIQLVQINQLAFERKFLPYSVALLQAYTLRHALQLSRYTFLPILFERLPLQENIQESLLADILAFSTYVWNMNYSLAMAHKLKQIKPQTITIFGGPQVPDRAEAFLRQNPQVDVCCHGEGETVFLELLDSLPARNWSQIKGISYLSDEGLFIHQPRADRRKDLDAIPSPYLLGIFDPLFKKYPNYRWTAPWETNRGCPFSCTFCDWGSATAAKVNRFGMERLQAEIRWFARHRIDMVYCCDANFGILPRDIEITEYMVQTKDKMTYPRGFYIQNAKNATERTYQIQKQITQSGMNPDVTLSLQSVNPEVLKAIRRDNISLEAYKELQHRFQRDGINTYTDFLVGLPGETYASFADGIERIISEGQHNIIKFYNVYILPNAEMAQPEYRKKYGLITAKTPYYEPYFPVNLEVQEWQEMIVGHDTLPPEDWCRIRVLAWWVEILYINRKLLQLPLILIWKLTGIGFREMFETYLNIDFSGASLIQELNRFLFDKARSIQAGEPEFCLLEQRGKDGTWLTAEDFAITGLYKSEAIDEFYQNHEVILSHILDKHQKILPPGLLAESIQLSRNLFLSYALEQPFEQRLDFHIWDFYEGILQGVERPLVQGHYRYTRDWKGFPFHKVRVL